jgi:(1->4)-alpha-D-glucan 1-alpha-D-glucosylmutase
MIDEADLERVLAKAKRRAAAAKRYPVATYRWQFNRSFTFRDAAALVPYLHELGISDIYASPYFKSRPGSSHGYDVTDYSCLNPEIGSDEDYRGFVSQLHRHGLGQILDFVPNHMSIMGNPWWTHVLENGPGSPYAQFFDIDWYPAKVELHEKVLLPLLEDQYGRILESGQLRLALDRGAFRVSYGELTLPVDPKTAEWPLADCLEQLRQTPGESDPAFLEMQGIITECRNLPSRHETAQHRVAERLKKKEMARRRLEKLCQTNEKVSLALGRVLDTFNGGAGDNRSFDRLHRLLEQQAYRLSHWRVALDEINYRRFFDVNELAAIRMENKPVFDLSHQRLYELIREGAVTGLRIDHIDGLWNPAQYLWELQRTRFIELCRYEIEHDASLSATDRNLREEKLLEAFKKERRLHPDSAITRPLFVVVEKILGEKEDLNETWPVDGTTGYEFAAVLNGIFVNRRQERTLRSLYRRFTGLDDDFQDITYHSKNLIMQTSMSAETNVLARRLDRVSEKSRWYRDFTLNSLRDAIREVIACFPVYRTYIDAADSPVSGRDKAVINAAVAEAKKRHPALSSSIFDFLRDTLLLKYPPDMDEEGRREQQRFVMQFQQLTGPVMAKGVEDTAFYRYHRLVSLNDVGGHPQRFGNTVDEFHRQNARRQNTRRHSLLTTSTHDAKRSEDVRARINVLSEMTGEWQAALLRWSRLNGRKRIRLNGESLPDRNTEYLIYQTLLGTYPIEEMNKSQRDSYQHRIQNYVLKAIREAKVHTSWVIPDTAYEKSVMTFIARLLDASPSNSFLTDFLVLNRQIAYCGMYNSLAQLVLKVFSPGTPDFYQGNELWNFSLVDPDNRRPVDFSRRIQLLESLKTRAARNSLALAGELMGNVESGEIKLYITWRALNYLRDHTDLFHDGAYVPLKAEGSRKGNICAFAWQKADQQTIVMVPRLVAGLTRNGTIPPVGPQAWGDTALLLPGRRGVRAYRHIFTGEILESNHDEKRATLPLAKVFTILPVAAVAPVSR